MADYLKTFPTVDAGHGVTRQVMADSPELMTVSFTFGAGGVGLPHSHPHLQATFVQSGRFEFTVAGRSFEVSAGDAFVIPSNAVHSCKAIEPGVLIDTFTPRRDDFLYKDPAMLTVETRHAIDPVTAAGFDTEQLRDHFHVGGLFRDGEIRLIYTHYDRMIVGGATPAGGSQTLAHVAETGTPGFLDRRELAVVNIGGAGAVEAAEGRHVMEKGDVLYLGMGAGPVTFSGDGRFYLLSAPAHASHPTKVIRLAEAASVSLGSAVTSNARTIFQFVHPDVMTSCQLVVGYTRLEPGSVWNTMPAHVHDRRMEAYLYFDLDPNARVIHLMGEPDETRHLVLANEEGALSPPWSIHSGAGTTAYTFIWAMAGDNVDYKDVEMVAMDALR